MAQRILIGRGTAGNTVDVKVAQMPTGMEGFISNITAVNPTGGALNLTISILESDGSTTVVSAVKAVAAGATVNFKEILPQNLQAGNQVLAKGSGAGIIVRVSGLQLAIPAV